MSGPALLLVLVALGLGAAGCSGGAEEGGVPASGESGTTARDDLNVSTTGWATDFSKHTVPLSEFMSGGPGKDGIPAIDEPTLVSVGEAAEWLGNREPVIELELDDVARAYPLQILVWHEIVNDEVAGTPVAVTFCPLCNTAIVFDRRLDGRVLDFGTTGNLRHSDLVMYDRQTESWWQQFGGEAVAGELAGAELRLVPSRIVASEDFAKRHPEGEVLSRDTGFGRDYGRNPYAGYDSVDSSPFFPAAGADDDRLLPKERVVFIELGDDAVAVPFSVLAEAKRVEVEVGGERLEVRWVSGVRSALDTPFVEAGREVGSAEVRSLESGEPVAFDQPFWFAVASFRPDIRIVGEEKAARSSSPSSGKLGSSRQESSPRRGYLAPNY
jgi:Protein of unknown function (DUF3179)